MKTILGVLAVLLAVALATPSVHAHHTKVVGDKYKVIVGFVREPIFTMERNGLDLIIRRADNNEPVDNLEKTLSAVLISPDGYRARVLKVRAKVGQAGLLHG